MLNCCPSATITTEGLHKSNPFCLEDYSIPVARPNIWEMTQLPEDEVIEEVLQFDVDVAADPT